MIGFMSKDLRKNLRQAVTKANFAGGLVCLTAVGVRLFNASLSPQTTEETTRQLWESLGSAGLAGYLAGLGGYLTGGAIGVLIVRCLGRYREDD